MMGERGGQGTVAWGRQPQEWGGQQRQELRTWNRFGRKMGSPVLDMLSLRFWQSDVHEDAHRANLKSVKAVAMAEDLGMGTE
jgi:hypothetical protein